MSIRPIDQDKCIGCGQCVTACPMDVIRFDEKAGKAVAVYIKDCYCCYNCERECPVGAVFVDPRRAFQIPPAWL